MDAGAWVTVWLGALCVGLHCIPSLVSDMALRAVVTLLTLWGFGGSRHTRKTRTFTNTNPWAWQVHSWEQWRAHWRDPENPPQLPDRKSQIVNGDHTHFLIFFKGSIFFYSPFSHLEMPHSLNCRRAEFMFSGLSCFSTNNLNMSLVVCKEYIEYYTNTRV